MPVGFRPVSFQSDSGKLFGWLPVGDEPEAKYHREVMHHYRFSPPFENGTYELLGPKIQGNAEYCDTFTLVKHGAVLLPMMTGPTNFNRIRDYLERTPIEGIVWHHADGRMAKIKRRDFGFEWPVALYIGEEDK
jgi:hypothetical protein